MYSYFFRHRLKKGNVRLGVCLILKSTQNLEINPEIFKVYITRVVTPCFNEFRFKQDIVDEPAVFPMNNCRIHVVKVILDFQGRGLVSIIFLT
jgi:hypothetical protein